MMSPLHLRVRLLRLIFDAEVDVVNGGGWVWPFWFTLVDDSVLTIRLVDDDEEEEDSSDSSCEYFGFLLNLKQ